MFSNPSVIQKEERVRDIVAKHHQTADVFFRHGIDFCCGGKWPLEAVCTSKGMPVEELIAELETSLRNVQLPSNIRFEDWELPFLADFIVHVHHQYLKSAMPVTTAYVRLFLEGHEKKFPELKVIASLVSRLHASILTQIKQEEEVYFPYIKRIAHAHLHREPYADLLVRTLRKPLRTAIAQDLELQENLLQQIRTLTDQYTPPEKACLTHQVTFFKLKEFDHDLIQHLYLENTILFPRAIAMEEELLGRGRSGQ